MNSDKVSCWAETTALSYRFSRMQHVSNAWCCRNRMQHQSLKKQLDFSQSFSPCPTRHYWILHSQKCHVRRDSVHAWNRRRAWSHAWAFQQFLGNRAIEGWQFVHRRVVLEIVFNTQNSYTIRHFNILPMLDQQPVEPFSMMMKSASVDLRGTNLRQVVRWYSPKARFIVATSCLSYNWCEKLIQITRTNKTGIGEQLTKSSYLIGNLSVLPSKRFVFNAILRTIRIE